MNMVAHFRMKADFDSEQSGEFSLNLTDPIAPMLIALTCNRVFTTEERSTDTSVLTVKNPNFTWADYIFTRTGLHLYADSWDVSLH